MKFAGQYKPYELRYCPRALQTLCVASLTGCPRLTNFVTRSRIHQCQSIYMLASLLRILRWPIRARAKCEKKISGVKKIKKKTFLLIFFSKN